jgi:dihydrofolate synthase/folylpolyglutamate synthase
MVELAGLLGNPELAYPVIHVTGTNGKGSTVGLLSCLLRARGLRVGAYTSPDLGSVNERMSIAGEQIGDEALAEVLASVADAADAMSGGPPSRFEILTAAGLSWFCDQAVDAAVVEVGMGGRHDATNVVNGQVAVVTNVSLDHTELMGPTTMDIAREKAGIVRPGSTVVLGELDPTLLEVFRSAGGSRCWTMGVDFACESTRIAHGGHLADLRTPGARYPDIFVSLHGAHQGLNGACALAAAEAFFDAPLHPDVVAEGFAAVTVPGRMEVVGRHPLCILDGAHNEAGMRAAGATLVEEFGSVQRWVVVMGLLGDKDPDEMIRALAGAHVGRVIACAPASPRAADPAALARAATALGIESEVADKLGPALDRASQIAGRDEGILVTGSLYLVGAARTILVGRVDKTRPTGTSA